MEDIPETKPPLDVNAPVGIRSRLKLLKPIVSLAVIANAIAITILFFYLKRIGWVELLQASVASEKGMALVLIFLVVTIVAVAIVFYSASYILFLAASLFDDPKQMPKHLTAYVCVMHIFWLAVLALALWGSVIKEEQGSTVFHTFAMWSADNLSWLMGSFLVAGMLLSAVFHRLRRRNYTVEKRYWQNVVLGFLVAFASAISTLVLWAALTLQGSGLPQDTPWQIVFPMLVVTVPGVLMGVVLLKTYRETANINKAISMAGLIAMVFLITMFSVLPRYTVFPIAMAALRAAAVYSTEPATFQLVDVKQRDVYENAGFKHGEQPLANDDMMYFDGYVRYRFAGVLLLCSSAYDPLKGDIEEEARKTRAGCVQPLSGEVRRVQLEYKG